MRHEETVGVGVVHADLLAQIRSLLAGNPAGARIRLMYKPAGLDLAPGQALLPRAADGQLELHPANVPAPPPGSALTAAPGSVDQARIAAEIVNRVWVAILKTGDPDPSIPDPVHLHGVFDPAWLQTLPLPIDADRPSTQNVALIKGHTFERFTDNDAVHDAYERDGRTRVYELVSERNDGWLGLAARQFTRLAGCRVACTVYQSNAGDTSIVEHTDNWYGAVLQTHGEKRWAIRPNRDTEPRQITTRAGDVLLLPRENLHEVNTPGHSTHIVFAFLTHMRYDQPVVTPSSEK